MASRNEIPESGPGLLGGFMMGAIGGAEQYIQEENTSRRAFALEDYRAQRERELADYKAELARAERAEGYAREDAATARDEKWKRVEFTAERKSEREAREDQLAAYEREAAQRERQYQLDAQQSKEQDDPLDKQPDGSEKTAYLEYVLPDIESAYPELAGSSGVSDALTLGKETAEDRSSAEYLIRQLSAKKDDARAKLLVDALRKYKKNSGVWTHREFRNWADQTSELLNSDAFRTAAPPPTAALMGLDALRAKYQKRGS